MQFIYCLLFILYLSHSAARWDQQKIATAKKSAEKTSSTQLATHSHPRPSSSASSETFQESEDSDMAKMMGFSGFGNGIDSKLSTCIAIDNG